MTFHFKGPFLKGRLSGALFWSKWSILTFTVDFLTLKLDHGRTLRSNLFKFDLKMAKMGLWAHFSQFDPFRLRRKGHSFPRKGNFHKFMKIFPRKIPGVWNFKKFLIFEIFSFGPGRSGIYSRPSRVPGVWNFLFWWNFIILTIFRRKIVRQRPKRNPLDFQVINGWA